MIFADTSALFAAFDARDENHDAAARALRDLRAVDSLVTHNYILVEMAALLRRRIGWDAERAFLTQAVPELEVVWVDEATHRAAVASLVAAPRDVSLVDWVSFEVMRQHGLRRAFAFDRDFRDQGFELVPS